MENDLLYVIVQRDTTFNQYRTLSIYIVCISVSTLVSMLHYKPPAAVVNPQRSLLGRKQIWATLV